MATSLAQQLGSLSSKAAKLDIHPSGDSKHQASFLFRQKDAATIDRDTVYRLGYNALLELCKIEPRFQQFSESLFSESAKHVERTVSNKKENEILDVEISKFFVMLAPYLQLAPALTVLEWLIARFHVEKFNSEGLIVMFLPFHELKLFTRALQVVFPKDPKNHWNWTMEAIKNGVLVGKDDMLRFFAKRLDYVQLVAEFVVKLCEEHSSKSVQYYVSFFMVISIAAIDRQKKDLNETQIASLVKTIQTVFLHSQPQLQICACAILVVLLNKIQFENSILNTIITMMIKNCDESLLLNVVQVVFIGLQQQELFVPSVKMLSRLSRKPTFLESLSSLPEIVEMEKCTPMYKFILCLVQNITKLDSDICFNVLSNYFGEGAIRTEEFSQIIYTYLSVVTQESSGEEGGELQELVDVRLVTLFMRKYCKSFDIALSKLRQESGEDTAESILSLVEQSDSLASLTVQLSSANVDFRAKGLKSLKRRLLKNKEVDVNVGYHLLTCMKDPGMFVSVLEVGENLWKLMKPEELIDVLFDKFWSNFHDESIIASIANVLSQTPVFSAKVIILCEVLHKCDLEIENAPDLKSLVSQVGSRTYSLF